MNEILQFLNDNKPFYIATTEDGVPHLRPFGFSMVYEGKIFFCTSNTKAVFKQLSANPHCEICTTAADSSWLRLCGKAVFVDDIAAKKKALEVAPRLVNVYQTAENPIFEIFYLAEPKAAISKAGQAPRIIEL